MFLQKYTCICVFLAAILFSTTTVLAVDDGASGQIPNVPISSPGYRRITSLDGQPISAFDPPQNKRLVVALSDKYQHSLKHPPPASAWERDKQEECVPMQPWQDEVHLSCNEFHERPLAVTDNDSATSRTLATAILGEGRVRTGWAQHDKNDANDSTTALTTLRWNVMDKFVKSPRRVYERNNMDASILDRLTGVQCVLQIYGSCGTSMVTELADSQSDFYEKVYDLSPLEKLSYSAHISSCLADIHAIDEEGNATIVHDDLHPGNVLFVNGEPKIGDFNKARMLRWNATGQQKCDFVSGQTRIDPWVSPEKATSIPSNDESRDLYNLGGLLYTILHQSRVPFENDSPEVRLQMKLNGTLPAFDPEYIESNDPAIEAILQAIRGTLVPDPKERPRARQIGSRLRMVLAAALRQKNRTTTSENDDERNRDICQAIHADPKQINEEQRPAEEELKPAKEEERPADLGLAPKMVLVVYLFPLFFLVLYTVARSVNILRAAFSTRFFTDKPAERSGRIRTGEEPVVTIQISTYNEGNVVADTIKACCTLQWPPDKLFIDICDDSTDKESLAIIEEAVQFWSNSVNIVHRRRPDRIGYKAGCLKYHFDKIQGDYVALFDADHQPEPDFLLRTMPFFFDKDGESIERVGLVQTPWGYYNTHENILTETDTLGLDVHHTIEQTGRGGGLNVFGFNGTGGIWRKDAIEAGGGWSWDTVTEDLALSYLSFMKGYDFVFVRDLPQLMESPSCILAHVQQKHRWTKGYLQVFRISFLEIFCSSATSLAVKVEAFTHMTGPCQYACLLAMTVTYPLLVYFEIDSDLILVASTLPHLVPLFEAALAIYVKVAGSDGEYKSFLARTIRFTYVLPLMMLKNGMMIFETRAIFDGLFSNDATFLATPKEGAAKKKKSANGVYHSWIDGAVGWSGIVLALYRLSLFYFVELHQKRSRWSHIWFGMLSLSVSVGLLSVHGSFLRAKYRIAANNWLSYALCQNRGCYAGHRQGRGKKSNASKEDEEWAASARPDTGSGGPVAQVNNHQQQHAAKLSTQHHPEHAVVALRNPSPPSGEAFDISSSTFGTSFDNHVAAGVIDRALGTLHRRQGHSTWRDQNSPRKPFQEDNKSAAFTSPGTGSDSPVAPGKTDRRQTMTAHGGYAHKSTARLVLLMSAFVMYTTLIVFSILEHMAVLSDQFLLVAPPSEWACPVESGSLVSHLTPLVVFAQPRSGSNLLLDMLSKMQSATSDRDLEMVTLGELFRDNGTGRTEEKVASTMPVLRRACLTDDVWLEGHTPQDQSLSSHDRHLLKALGPEAYLESLQQPLSAGGLKWPRELIEAFQNRSDKPYDLLSFLSSIPSKSKTAFFAFKVFKGHLNEGSMTPQTMVDALTKPRRHGKSVKFVVLWRRRIIESFVSSQIAHVSGNWVHATTSADNAILVKKDELEMYIEEKRRYYLDVKEALLGAGVDFEVFEYDRDLRQVPQQVGTMKRLLGLMFDSSDDVTISPKKIFKHVHIEKQAIVPLHEQVKNWNDVVEWGYGGESKEWEDLFHEEIPYCWDKKPSV